MRRNAVLSELVALLGDGFVLPTQGRDPDLLYVVQLEAIRDHLKAKASNVIPFAASETTEEAQPKKVKRANANP